MTTTLAEDVVAPPNWLRELEEKREAKVRARLGHEAGAGAPCLTCAEKCPGLDLHFWRKICKNCKCGKENHGVYDDDVSGWVQFQLLGSKPKRTTHKIRLSGPNELELDWTPKGSKEAVERYLKDLPPDQLPIKGSSAAQERKQLLQKQIPIHDVDPSLCHALSEEETKRMRDYVSHLKETSVGVGQLLNYQAPSFTGKLNPASGTATRHDYENIDAFGNHKLAASLEAIRRQQRSVLGEQCDEYGTPARAQYAMLLDAAGSPLKDAMGKPLKAALDLFGAPIFDAPLVERIPPLARAEYALLLDRNGAPMLGAAGNPVKRRVDEPPPETTRAIFDKFGNEVRPHMGVLLDRSGAPVVDSQSGSPVRVKMDVYGRPIFEKALSEVFALGEHGPKYISYLDRNGAPILDATGAPVRRAIFGSDERPQFAVFLDSERGVLRDQCGDPITAHMDHFRAPVVENSTLEELGARTPAVCVLLDRRGEIVDARSFNAYREAIVDKFENAVRPQYGLLLDEHECPMKDATGSPIKVPLDAFLRPRYEAQVVEKLGSRHPEYVMFLDRNGAPILDKYGSPIKNIAYGTRESLGAPRYAMLLDKNEQPLTDAQGALVDILGRPIEKHLQQDAKYAMPLDAQGGTTLGVQPITYLHVPSVAVSKQLPKPQWTNHLARPDNQFLNAINGARLVTGSGAAIVDQHGAPVEIQLDHYGCAIMQASNMEIQGAQLIGAKGAPLLDKHGQPLRVKVDRNGATVDGTPIYLDGLELKLPPVVDKYGNVIDPHTGRPLNLALAAMTLQRPVEDPREPHRVNIGIVNDINYPNYANHNHNQPNPPLASGQYPASEDIPECHRCKQMIDDNAVVIQIDRAADALWHTGCFKCAGCNQPLVDLFYYYHKESDDVYCGRDYAKMRGIPRCNACDELIFVKEYCLTEDTTYHIKHFCCFECDTPLAGKDYLCENNQPVCLPCYELLKADKCMACGYIIRPNEPGVNLNGDHFHASDKCFACRTCRQPLLDAKLLYRNKRLYCSGACFAAG